MMSSTIKIESDGKLEITKRGNTIAQFGISTAMLTPFHDDSSLNIDLFCVHAKAMLARGAAGVTLFGTTGEGASIGLHERTDAIAAMTASGVPEDVMTLGVCASAIADALLQVEQGVEHGVTQFLLLPPFYFKGGFMSGMLSCLHWLIRALSSFCITSLR